MKTWHFAVVALLLPAIAGCRSDPNIAILERELRHKEDEIYRLKWAIEDLQDTSSCSDDWRPRSSESETAPSRRSGSAPPSGATPPAIELPSRPTEGVPDSLVPPGVPEHSRGPSGPALDKGVDGVSAVVPLMGMPIRPSGDSRQTTTIALNRTMTGGINGDGADGDQGLMAVVEPRDATGRPLDAPAEISAVVLDPAITDAEGKAVCVARWEYTTAETAELFRRAGSSLAIHLMMAWPDERPKHNKLHLFTRYVTADGRELQDDIPIEIALPGDRSSRWTPAELDRTEQQIPALEARRVEPQPVSSPRPAPRVATRERKPKMKRPVWSPERPR